jgi:Ni,Fe-hydrogenase III large subunit
MTDDLVIPAVVPNTFGDAVATRVHDGFRFAGLFATAQQSDTRLLAVLIKGSSLVLEQTVLLAPLDRYSSLAADVPAALWYEREIHDLFGLTPINHPRLDPLVFAFAPQSQRPRPGSGVAVPAAEPNLTPMALHLRGEGVFTISYGPVRSGVFESIEYVVETPGEDIPHLSTRVSYKHRGTESRFEGMSVDDGVLLAERCEGVASVAHALSFCGAIERIGDIAVSLQASLVRTLHAELERIANHLDSTIRHTEAAGQAVAYARFTLHKESVQRLRAQLCGSRFGRGVVVPGGVAGPLALGASEIVSVLEPLQAAIGADTRLLMNTPSFLDRLRGTGIIDQQTISRFGALGPVARGSGEMEDARCSRPYAAYGHLGYEQLEARVGGDALARQRVRAIEIQGSFDLIRCAVNELDRRGEPEGSLWAQRVPVLSGEAVGWAEAPQGELLTWVQVNEGVLTRVKPRSASFHNLALFPMAFPADILTDFAFIEASFGLSIAGVAS